MDDVSDYTCLPSAANRYLAAIKPCSSSTAWQRKNI